MIVIYGKRLERQVEAAIRWRKEHHGPPASIRAEIHWLADHLAVNPRMGRAVENPRTPGLRRFPLHRIGYVAFWTVDDRRGEVTITDIRHAKRRPIRM